MGTLLLASEMPVPIPRYSTVGRGRQNERDLAMVKDPLIDFEEVVVGMRSLGLNPGAFDCWVLFSRQGAETRAAGILEFRPAWLSSRRVSAGSI